MAAQVAQPVLLLVGGEHAGQAALGDHHALGLAGRAAGEDDVGEVVGAAQAGGSSLGLARQRFGIVDETGRLIATQRRVCEAPVAEQQRGLCVGDHELQALGRIGRIERDVGAAGLDHAEDGGHELGRLLHRDADERVGPDALGAQAPGDAVGVAVELGVGHPLALAHDGHGVWASRRTWASKLSLIDGRADGSGAGGGSSRSSRRVRSASESIDRRDSGRWDPAATLCGQHREVPHHPRHGGGANSSVRVLPGRVEPGLCAR